MAQHSGVIADQAGLAFLSDLNNALMADKTLNSGAAEPATKYAGMLWLDTSTTPPVLKLRNQANDGWDAVSALLDAEVMPSPTASGYVKRNAANNGYETKTAQQVANDVVPLAIRYAPGHLYGLTLSNNTTDANNDIDIAVGSARDSADAVNLTLSSAITKRLDAAWAAGTGNGGLDTGAKAVSTWYYPFVIRKDSDGSVDVLFSASPTSPTMPSGYTAKRRVGAFMTDGAGNIRGFTQSGDEFFLDASIADVNVANLGTSVATYTLTVPAVDGVRAMITGTAKNAAAWQVSLTPKGSGTTAIIRGAAGVFGGFGQVYIRAVDSEILALGTVASTELILFTSGWIDSRN